MSWTPEQVEAIQLRDKNILVSASAGSGKTAVLVERILSLIAEGFVPLSQFLIVTFTNAAAQEMRDRISKRLMVLKRENPHTRAFVNEQLQKVQQAHISTLHSFCKDVIAKHFYILDIDPNFRIGSQQLLALKQQEALDAVLERHYASNATGFISLMGIYSSHRGDDAIKQLLLNLYQFSRAHPYPDLWLNQCVASYTVQGENTIQTFEQSPLAMAMKAKVGQQIAALTEQLNSAIAMCQHPEGPEAYEQSLKEDLIAFEAAQNLKNFDSWSAFEKAIAAIQFERLKSIKKADKERVDLARSETIKEMRTQVKKQFDALKKKYFSQPIGDALIEIGQMAPHLERLVALVKEFAADYWALKHAEQLVDFNDLEQLCIQALNHQEIAKVYQEQFRYVFVDEYQDTNRVQEEIVSLIRRPQNLFQVGDVKQSIYRFRMAEPELFLERFHRYPHDENAKRIDLNRNFRTHPHILEGVNHIFERLLTDSFGGLNYRDQGRLIAGREDFVGEARPQINLVMMDHAHNVASDQESDQESNQETDWETDQEQNDNHDEEGMAYDDADALEAPVRLTEDPEAQALYQRLLQILNMEFYDSHNKVTRRFQLGDVVVLMRSIKGRAQQIRDYMATKGIPVTIDEEDSYFDIVEVATVLNCLRILDNQHQDLPLLGVMRSPIGNFSDIELAQIRQWHDLSFHQAVEAVIAEDDTSLSDEQAVLKLKVQAFQDQLDSLRLLSHLPASVFLWQVLSKTGYWYFVSGLEEGHYRRQHLEVLMEKARQFELEQQSGLHHFVEYLNQMQKSRVSYGGKANDKTNVQALRVMSIHKSKGLEFPVVFIAGAAKRFNLQDVKARLVMHQRYGLGTKWIDPDSRLSKDTLPIAHLKGVLTEEAVMEEVRILYVALTRAVHRLEVFAAVKSHNSQSKRWERESNPFYLSQQRSYLDWIMTALVADQFDCGIGDTLTLNGWQIHHVNLNPAVNQLTAEAIEGKTLKDAFDEAVGLSWKALQKPMDAMPAKLSVTELKQQGQTLVYIPRISALSDDFEPLQDAIQRGNAYHAFAEHMPLDCTPTDEVLRQLAANGKLPEEQQQYLDIKHLIALRESHWYMRILNAKRIWREHPFVWRKSIDDAESTLIQGVVDMLFLESDGLVLIDYKSDRLFSADAFRKRYTRQLSLYTEAIETLLKIPVKETVIYAFQLGEWIAL